VVDQILCVEIVDSTPDLLGLVQPDIIGFERQSVFGDILSLVRLNLLRVVELGREIAGGTFAIVLVVLAWPVHHSLAPSHNQRAGERPSSRPGKPGGDDLPPAASATTMTANDQQIPPETELGRQAVLDVAVPAVDGDD
jgi:hypothetical protein